MSNVVVQAQARFGALAESMKARLSDLNDDLGAGIEGGYAVVGYRGKVWSIKHQGEETQLFRPDDGTPRAAIDIVILKAAGVKAKNYYANGFVEGSNSPPDCWSTNGVTPDASVTNPPSRQCATCPMNVFGSRTTDAGKQAKACSDHKRLAVVFADNIRNEMYGGPMLLRVPAASLKDVKTYADRLSAMGYPYAGVVTRIMFDPKDAYPHFVFGPVRALTDEEAAIVLEMRDDPKTSRIINEAVEIQQAQAAEAAAGGATAPEPESMDAMFNRFQQEAGKPAAAPQAAQQAAPAAQQAPKRQTKPKAAPAPAEALPAHDPVTGEVQEDDEEAKLLKQLAEAKARKAAAQAQAAKPAPAPAPVAEDAAEEDSDGTPDSFDDMLDNLLPTNAA